MGTTMQETPQTDGQRKLRYIELFAGIGGFGLALNRLGHVCVWANEWDKYAAEIYNKNFLRPVQPEGTGRPEERQQLENEPQQREHLGGIDTRDIRRFSDSSHLGEEKTERELSSERTGIESEGSESSVNGGKSAPVLCDTRDIRTVPTSEIPDHDLLVGGFPCQAFSIAGKRKGFDDPRGTLFFEIARILKDKQPKFFILENVKGLLSHDNGFTFKTIISTLTELGYDLEWQVLNSKNYGVPQNRERVFIVGHIRGEPRPKVFPIAETNGGSIKVCARGKHQQDIVYDTSGILNLPAGTHGSTPHLTKIRTNEQDSQERGNKSNDTNAIRRTPYSDGMRIRRLTPTECERLQGFPDGWTEKGINEKGEEVEISDTQRYKCLGNAVTVNVVYEVARRMCTAS